MIAALSANTHQSCQLFYDQLVSGWYVPQNPTAPRQQMSQEDCGKKFASIFGGDGAKAASLTEPSTLQHPDPRIPGSNRAGHLANSGAFHLYTNAQGMEATVGLYALPGWIGGYHRSSNSRLYGSFVKSRKSPTQLLLIIPINL